MAGLSIPESRRPAPPATITAAKRTRVIIGAVVTLRVLTLDDWPLWRAARPAAVALYRRRGHTERTVLGGLTVMVKTLE
jgi:hypothetical protein